MSDKRSYNLSFYKDAWSGTPVVDPVHWPEYAALQPYCRGEVLEVGPGVFPRSAAPTTVYLEPERTSAARLRAWGGDVRDGSLEQLPFPSQCFDTVLALDVLEHVDDDQAALAEIVRVLRPGGCLVVSVPLHQRYWSDLDVLAGHTFRYDPQVLLARLASVGLVAEVGHVYRPAHPSLKRVGDRLLFMGVRWLGIRRAMAAKAWWIQRTSWLVRPVVFWPVASIPADANALILVLFAPPGSRASRPASLRP